MTLCCLHIAKLAVLLPPPMPLGYRRCHRSRATAAAALSTSLPEALPPRLPRHLRHRPAVALPPPCGHRRCCDVFVAAIAVLLPLLPPPGERGMMVAMGHGLCVSFWVSGEMTKNKVGPKKLQCALEYLGCPYASDR
jgi:hypothetical protein